MPLRRAVTSLLESGLKQGQVRPCDPAGITDLIFAMLDGTMVQRLARGANVLVAGSSLFRDPEGRAHAVSEIRSIATAAFA